MSLLDTLNRAAVSPVTAYLMSMLNHVDRRDVVDEFFFGPEISNITIDITSLETQLDVFDRMQGAYFSPEVDGPSYSYVIRPNYRKNYGNKLAPKVYRQNLRVPKLYRYLHSLTKERRKVQWQGKRQ